MYRYHNELRFPHGASSPWWAWPLGLKPIWGYYEVFVDGTEALLMGDGNPVLLWMAMPAVAWGVWAAWKRRSASLLFLLIAFAVMWLPWARIDRVAYNYHYYTALPFALALLAYFLAELWDGPAARTWKLARISFAVVLAGPALLWLLRDPLCVVGGATTMDPTSFACTRSMDDILAPIIGWLIAAAVIGWWVLGWRRPRWLVGAVIGLAAVVFLVLYPALAAWPLPTGWPFVYQGLLPSWEGTFLFGSNPNPVVVVPLVGFGSLALTGIVVVVLGALIVAMTRVLGFERDSGRAPTEA
jgi:hypothetical protein